MRNTIRIISSYQPTKETKRRLDRLASLILKNADRENIADRKDDKSHKPLSKNVFS
ncbi:MAG: hypothetical protein Q8O30_01000 [Candidatus Omnitrophota bacterium]|nr:hypothetical protein [Candidatus Omnitrophota bacterium]